MRVLYVVQRYGEQIAGGAEQHARAFAERLVERDHRVTVLTTCAQSYVDWANAILRGLVDSPTACRCSAFRWSCAGTTISSADSTRA